VVRVGVVGVTVGAVVRVGVVGVAVGVVGAGVAVVSVGAGVAVVVVAALRTLNPFCNCHPGLVALEYS